MPAQLFFCTWNPRISLIISLEIWHRHCKQWAGLKMLLFPARKILPVQPAVMVNWFICIHRHSAALIRLHSAAFSCIRLRSSAFTRLQLSACTRSHQTVVCASALSASEYILCAKDMYFYHSCHQNTLHRTYSALVQQCSRSLYVHMLPSGCWSGNRYVTMASYFSALESTCYVRSLVLSHVSPIRPKA